MADQTDADDSAVPFELERPHPNAGVGAIRDIISLARHAGEGLVTDEGRCRHCGYDRGIASSHTEVPGSRVTCRECDAILIEDRPE